MRTRTVAAALALGLSLALAYPAVAQEYEEAVLAAYEQAMTPSAPHAKIAELEGNWDLTVTSWMQPGDPVVTKATSSRKMVLGGRYLSDAVEGTAMGQPFMGHGWFGFNNTSEEFESTWIDNFGTGIYMSRGKWDDEANGIVMYGSYLDPVSGKKTKVKTVSRMEGPDKEILAWYEKAEGAEESRKTMEIVAVRR